MKKTLFNALICLISLTGIGQGNNYVQNYKKFENLAMTPPMGWNSWNKFGCNIDEKLVKEIADAMVSSGMKDAGYQYINIDDCWHGERDSLGFIHPNATRFPSGMKALADYVHSKGLKIGVYSDAGSQTCGGKPGSRGYEFQDAQTYAKWGIDYLKFDWCNTEGLRAEGAYKTITAALRRAGRPVVLSICEWGNDKPWEWGQNVGHLWRTTGDIYNCFDCINDHGSWKSWGVMQILDKQEAMNLRKYVGPGRWNDPDMLEIGNGKMTMGEDKAQFSMWSMIAAPLIAGNDLRKMSSATKEVLMNKEVIAVSQDELGIQGYRYVIKDSVETWLKPLKDGKWAVTFLNRSKQTKRIALNWKAEIITDKVFNKVLDANVKTYKIRNLWSKMDAGTTNTPLNVEIPAHDVLMLKLE